MPSRSPTRVQTARWMRNPYTAPRGGLPPSSTRTLTRIEEIVNARLAADAAQAALQAYIDAPTSSSSSSRSSGSRASPRSSSSRAGSRASSRARPSPRSSSSRARPSPRSSGSRSRSSPRSSGSRSRSPLNPDMMYMMFPWAEDHERLRQNPSRTFQTPVGRLRPETVARDAGLKAYQGWLPRAYGPRPDKKKPPLPEGKVQPLTGRDAYVEVIYPDAQQAQKMPVRIKKKYVQEGRHVTYPVVYDLEGLPQAEYEPLLGFGKALRRKSKAKAKTKAKAKAKPKAKPKAKSKAKPKAKPKVKSKVKSKAKPQVKSKAKPKAKAKRK